MEKRICRRTLALMECHCSNLQYFGTIINFSENGMYIKSQKLNLPIDIYFDLFVPVHEQLLKVKVKIVRMTKSNGYYDSIGVEILNAPEKYKSYISGLN